MILQWVAQWPVCIKQFAVPGNTIPTSWKVTGNSWGWWGGSPNPKILKESMKLIGNFQRGGLGWFFCGGLAKQKTFLVEGMDLGLSAGAIVFLGKALYSNGAPLTPIQV